MPWEIEDLESGFDRGNPGPPLKTMHSLFEILHDFDTDKQRLFLRFLTGCARLPIGGKKVTIL